MPGPKGPQAGASKLDLCRGAGIGGGEGETEATGRPRREGTLATEAGRLSTGEKWEEKVGGSGEGAAQGAEARARGHRRGCPAHAPGPRTPWPAGLSPEKQCGSYV